MIKAIIFDIGGVFLRTEDRSVRQQLEKRLGLAAAEVLDELGIGLYSRVAADSHRQGNFGRDGNKPWRAQTVQQKVEN